MGAMTVASFQATPSPVSLGRAARAQHSGGGGTVAACCRWASLQGPAMEARQGSGLRRVHRHRAVMQNQVHVTASNDHPATTAVVEQPCKTDGRSVGRSGSHSRRIFRDLQQVASLEEARHLVDAELGNFSAANCSTSLKTIGALTRSMSGKEKRQLGTDPLVLRLQDAVLARLNEMGPPQLADIVWAYGRMGHHPGLLLEAVNGKAVEQMAAFRLADISKVMWAYARLGHLPSELFDAIAAVMISSEKWKAVLTDGSAIALSNMVWACGKLRYANVGLLDTLASLTLAKLPEYTPQGLSNTVWGFAVLKYHSAELLDAVAAAAAQQVDAFSTAGLVNLTWSFGFLDYSNPAVTDTLIPEAGLRIPRGNPQDVSNLAVTCARLGAAPPDVLEAIADRALSTIDAFKPEEYAGLLWAFASLKVTPPCPLFTELRATVTSKAQQCSPRDVSTILWAFSRINKQLMPEELACMVDRARELMPSMDHANAVGALSALARLSPSLPPSQSLIELVDAAWGRFSHEDLVALPAAELPGLLWAFNRLDRRVRDFDPADKGKWAGQGKRRKLPGRLVDLLVGRVGTLNKEEFVLLLFTLGSYRQPLPPAALDALTTAASRFMGRLTSRELSQCMWAVSKLGYMDADMMDLAVTVLPIKLSKAVPQDVAMMLCAFATLGCKNFAVCELYAEWAAQRPEDFSATDLCNAVWAFAELTYHPGLDRLGKLLAEVDRRPKEFSAENQSTLKWAKRRLKSVYNSKPQLEPGYLRRTQSYTQSDYASKVAEARQRRISSIADWYADETVYDYYSEEWGDVWW
mmetsp:Transcript_31766/g.79568  ORF Transcript_31766/g.79568 Transcript_31766/m.79568 type:complete len:807 (-) Transcript_31766:102-2522(-)